MKISQLVTQNHYVDISCMISYNMCVHMTMANIFTLTNIAIIGTQQSSPSYLVMIIHL